MEQIVIRNLPEGTKAALRARAARHHHSVEAEARAILTAGVAGEDVPMSALLAADSGQEIDFEPERLGLTARTSDL
ncbi:antitoxin (plasmid) [Mycobacterium sp. MS1601]|nr:antitoxin [Mycobacterium sp. MS1601]